MNRVGMITRQSAACALKVVSIARLTFLASGIQHKKTYTVDTCLPVCLSTIYSYLHVQTYTTILPILISIWYVQNMKVIARDR